MSTRSKRVTWAAYTFFVQRMTEFVSVKMVHRGNNCVSHVIAFQKGAYNLQSISALWRKGLVYKTRVHKCYWIFSVIWRHYICLIVSLVFLVSLGEHLHITFKLLYDPFGTNRLDNKIKYHIDVHSLINCHLMCFPTANPCANHTCPTGSRCRVFKPTGEAFCEPSCSINNGGCSANQTCSLEVVQCVRAPCPPVVKCTASEYVVIDKKSK